MQTSKNLSSIYLMGSLRNPGIPVLANKLRKERFDVFDDWFSAGSFADDYLRRYEKQRGHTYAEALEGYAAKHIFEFDKYHLDRCAIAVLLMPSGKSAFLELGYMIGQKKPGFILFDSEPKRIDIMFQFATKVFFTKEDLFATLRTYLNDENERQSESSYAGISRAEGQGPCCGPGFHLRG